MPPCRKLLASRAAARPGRRCTFALQSSGHAIIAEQAEAQTAGRVYQCAHRRQNSFIIAGAQARSGCRRWSKSLPVRPLRSKWHQAARGSTQKGLAKGSPVQGQVAEDRHGCWAALCYLLYSVA